MKAKLRELHKIETFEQSIEASKFISYAIFEGVLDDFGAIAHITPTDVALDANRRIVGVAFEISAPAKAMSTIVEGVVEVGSFMRELTKPGSNVRVLRPMSETWQRDDEIVQRFELMAS